MLLACREAGIHALTGLWEDLENIDGLREFALRGRQLGFRGMIAIHPRHVETVNDVFTPSAEDVALYVGMVAAYEAAAAEGIGALRYRGLHIDKAHYDKAVEWLQRAAALGATTGPPRQNRRRDSMTMRGLWFEEFEVGAHYKHALTRTITEMDNIMFTSLTMNLQPLHLDEEFSKKSIHGQRVLNSLFTVALIGAFHVPELTMGTTLGNLGYDKIKFPHPVFHGDTLRAETTIVDKRASKTRTDSGIVWFEHLGLNQRDEVVVEMTRVGLMATRPTDEVDEGATA